MAEEGKDEDLRGTYWRDESTGRIVRIMGRAAGHSDGDHWGREVQAGTGALPHKVIVRPDCDTWKRAPTRELCTACGIAPDVPLAIHQCDPGRRLEHQAILLYRSMMPAETEMDNGVAMYVDSLFTGMKQAIDYYDERKRATGS